MLASASGALAQLGGVHNYMDSSYIPASRMAQQNEWKNNSKTQNFPARPRDMWQVGGTLGLFMVDGDCPSLPGFNVGLSVRKALGYVLSLRGSITYGQAKGLDYRKNANLDNNAALNVYRPTWDGGQTAANTSGAYYVANFKNTTINPSLDVLVSFNNIMFHSKESKFNLYGFVGYAPIIYKTAIDALNGTARYNYPGLAAGFFDRSRKDIRSDLKNFFDGDYETSASLNDRRHNFGKSGLGKFNFRHSINIGMGLEYKLTKRMSLGLEAKYVMVTDDYLDGWSRAGEGYTNSNVSGQIIHNPSSLTPDKDNLLYTNLTVNFNVGNPAKRVAPLWWLNPLDYVYSELNNPVHTKFPKQTLLDTDDDGVTDQFDIEPNTPAGCPVDAKGKSRDTDGDGVPDCRDKELITPTTCQPVNADGVGKCPDPECCKNMAAATPVAVCPTAYPSLTFSGNSSSLNSDIRAMLATVASMMKSNPNCSIVINGYPEASKASQAVCNKRNEEIKKYLVESQGISADRVSSNCEIGGGAKNTVDIRSN